VSEALSQAEQVPAIFGDSDTPATPQEAQKPRPTKQRGPGTDRRCTAERVRIL